MPLLPVVRDRDDPQAEPDSCQLLLGLLDVSTLPGHHASKAALPCGHRHAVGQPTQHGSEQFGVGSLSRQPLSSSAQQAGPRLLFGPQLDGEISTRVQEKFGNKPVAALKVPRSFDATIFALNQDVVKLEDNQVVYHVFEVGADYQIPNETVRPRAPY